MALFFDGDFDFSVDLETFVKQDIKIGKKYSEEEYDELKRITQYEAAKAKAFRLISFKSFPAKILRERLMRDYDSESVDAVIARVAELGLINDREYALRYSRDLVNIKRFSLYRVKQELKQKGIDDEFIEEALEQFEDLEPEEQIAKIIYKKYINSLDSEKGLRRTTNALVRLGYSYSDIKSVIADITEA